MWILIVVAVVVLAVVVYAFWPRRRGVDDAGVVRGRRSNEASNEAINPTIGKVFPPGPGF